MTTNCERRLTTLSQLPVKLAKRADGKPVIEGYGAVYYEEGNPDTEYKLWTDTYERLMPGAFDRAIREDDVRSLFNHDPNIVLGRNKAGTLDLKVDKVGLFYAATPPDTQLARDMVVAPIERGDVSGSSFMFVPTTTVWIEQQRDDRTIYIREIREVALWEVGPVVFPAYKGATSGLRALEWAEARDAFTKWQGDRRSERDRVDVLASEVLLDEDLTR